jgi:quercetin dioxygenase-like cupin family protein
VTARAATRVAPFLRGPGDADQLDNPTGGAVTYWARGDETGGALTLLESLTAPGEGPPLHVHVHDDEFIFVLEGALRVAVAGVVRDARPGAFVFVPKGIPHTWRNAGDRAVRFLFGFAPAAPGMERFFAQAAELPAASRLVEGFRRFAGDAGIEVVGPPLPDHTELAGRAPARRRIG